MKAINGFFAAIGLVVILAVVGVGVYALGWVGEGAAVLREETGPRALVRKYSWFKDAAAQCDAKRATLGVYDQKIADMEKDYEGEKRKDWARTDREQLSQWQQERAGLIGSYNNLASEYNANMAKIHYKFCNVGELPPGATEPLPREFKPYITK